MKKPDTPISFGLWTFKGGEGKTTTALMFSEGLARKKLNVCYVDKDPQLAGQMLIGSDDADYSFTYLGANDAIPEEADVRVFDYAPGIEGKDLDGKHDLILVPIHPTLLGYNAAKRGLKTLPKGNRFLPVLTMVDNRSSDQIQWIARLEEEFGQLPQIPRLSIFEKAVNRSTTPYHLPKSTYGAERATEVFNDLASLALKITKRK